MTGSGNPLLPHQAPPATWRRVVRITIHSSSNPTTARSVRWPVVRQALEVVGYSGWMTIEGGDCSLAEHSKRLDQIIAGT